MFPEPSLTIYGCPLTLVHEVRFLMTFDVHLTWVPHLKSLCHPCQSSLDHLSHLSHTTTTLLRFYLVLVRSKLDYGTHVYLLLSLVPSLGSFYQ